MDQALAPADGLRRRLGPGLLTLYGVGVMVGAGIYVLVGTVADRAGILAPAAFVFAGLIAAPTALTYAELSVRIPESAGEAAYVRHGLRSSLLANAVGLAIVAVGVTSAAAVLRGGVGYLTSLIDVGATELIIAGAVLLTAVAVWGVLESLALAALFTIVEIGGLMLVIRAGFSASPSADWTAGVGDSLPVTGIAMATVLAFFAFVGFEDIVNLAEEVKRPSRTLPIAILTSLVITSLLYLLVSFAAVRAVDVSLLGESDRPLALVYERAGGSEDLLSAVATVAALNGVLAQMVMAARVLFGLGRRNRALAVFHQTSDRFGTPTIASLVVGVVVVLAALAVDVESLAELTSTFLLAVFSVMNATLLVIKRSGGPEPAFTVPRWVPWLGLAGSAIAFVFAVAG